MKNKRNIITIIISAIFAVVLSCAFIFSVRPSYARDVVIKNTDGTSVYITGEGVRWNEKNNKYEIIKKTDINVHVVNEYRIFESATVGNVKYETSFFTIYGVDGGEDLPAIEIEITARNFIDTTDDIVGDEYSYFAKPYVIGEDSELKALSRIFAEVGTDADFAIFDLTKSSENITKLSKSYFVLSENILLDTNEFYGIGTSKHPFAGCFDFKGYSVTLNVLNQYNSYSPYLGKDTNDNDALFAGFFGYVNGDGQNSSVLIDVDINGKIAFAGNTGNQSLYHYVGGLAGYVGGNTTICGANSEMSVTIENDSPLFIGGLFGCLNSPLEDRYDYTYACNYGVLQAKSVGESVNMSVGSLAGLIKDTYVNSFEDKSISTHLVANNIGEDNSGTAVVGGIAGTVLADAKDVYLRNIKMNLHEGKVITALINSSSLDEQVIAGGAFGIFESAGSKVVTDLVPIKINTGEIEIIASTNGSTSQGSVYAGGFIGKLNSFNHEFNYDPKEKLTLFDGAARIEAIQNGLGLTYAGGLFGCNALLINKPNDENNSSNNNDDTEDTEDICSIILSSGRNSTGLYVLAENSQSSVKDSDNNQYDLCAGYFSGRTQNDYSINNFELTVNYGELKAHRAIGSKSVGDVCAGGFIGKATSDRTNGKLTNITLNLNNSSVHALSLSYECELNDDTVGNNSLAGGFIGAIHEYGTPSFDGTTWGSSTIGAQNIYVYVNNDGTGSSEYTVRCVQNSVSGMADYKTEGYAGGVFGFYDDSYSENINFISLNEKALIYYNGTNTPNTAAAGGLIGETRSDGYNLGFGVKRGEVKNAHVVAKGYSKEDSNSYDLYCGGAVGVYGNCNGKTNLMTDLHVYDTTVQAIGEDKMLSFAGGIAGGIWYTGSNTLSGCSFVNGDVIASSVTHKAFAGGISGMIRSSHVYDSVASNAYVKAISNESYAFAAGVCSHYEELWTSQNLKRNYSQSYVAAEGGAGEYVAGIAVLNSGDGHFNPKSAEVSNDYMQWGGDYYYIDFYGDISYSHTGSTNRIVDNYFDLGSFGNEYLGNKNPIPLFANDTSGMNENVPGPYVTYDRYTTYDSKFVVTVNGISFTLNNPNNNNRFRYTYRYNYTSFSKINPVYDQNNHYVVLYEDETSRQTSLELGTNKTRTLFASIDNDNSGWNRFHIQFEGDRDDCFSTYSKTSDTNDTTSITTNDQNGLVIATVWININYDPNGNDYLYDDFDESKSLAELEKEGWYVFGSYPIKINSGRPSLDDDTIEFHIYDNEENRELNLVYDDSTVTGVSASTNIGSYYKSSDGLTYYALINIGQTGFSETEASHVAQSIRVQATLKNPGKPNNFPRYGFYDSDINKVEAVNALDLEATKWYAPEDYDYESRVEAILNSANRSTAYSSSFNGRLSVERLISSQSLVITPNETLNERTIITIEYANRTGQKPYVVILEFVPNNITGLSIEPAEDTPALSAQVESNAYGTGMTYVYVAGDTVRFEAYEAKRYREFSFLSNVKYTANADYGLKENGTIKLANTLSTGTIIPVECTLLANTSIKSTVYIKVLSNVSFNVDTVGASYTSDRKAVDSVPFNISFASTPGFGLAPERLLISNSKGASVNLASYLPSYNKNVSITNREIEVSGYKFILSYDKDIDTYSLVIPGSFTSGITSLNISIDYSVVYSIVFDTGIPNVAVNERYIVYTLKENTILDGSFYNVVYPEVFDAIKDDRYGFTLHDYFLTDDASSIPRYGDTFVTMTNPLVKKDANGDVLYYYYLVKNSKNEDEEVKLFLNSDDGKLYKDVNRNGTYEATTDNVEYYRYVTGPYTFYARWTYDIAIEVPDGITITSPLDPDKVIDLDPNDKIEGKSKLVPINTMNGFSFNIVADPSFEGKPRFMLFEVTKDSDDNYQFNDLTDYVKLVDGSSSTYTIPQYDDMGNSLINGVIFLKVFSETIDFEVSDIGEYGSVSVTNDIYEDGIFTATYGINYSKIKIGDTLYENGIPVSHTAGGNGVKFKFTDGSNNDLLLPSGTSLRVYRHINGTPYDAGELVLNSETNIVEINSFTNMFTGLNMSLANNLYVKNELYNLVVTLPKGYTGFEDISNAKIIAVTSYTESNKQLAYTLTFEYGSNGELIPVQPESNNVLMSSTRPDAFYEKAFDVFNIYNYNPASGLVSRVNAPIEQDSGFTLQFTPSSGKQPNIFDHRHGSSYYLWEVEKTYSTDEAGATVVRQYVAQDDAGTTVSIVSETQHYYYYLATNGNLNLSNVPAGCKIRLLEVDSITNPAAGVVIDTYGTN